MADADRIHGNINTERFQATVSKTALSPLTSPVAPQFTAEDYPVFTPSYVDEPPSPRYRRHLLKENNFPESWGEYGLDGWSDEDVISTGYRTAGKGLSSKLENFAEEKKVVFCSCDFTDVGERKFRRKSLGDLKSSSCNKCRPAIIISSESDGITKNSRKSNIIVPYTDSQSIFSPGPVKRMDFSRLFRRIKKKSEDSPLLQPQPNEVSVETLKKEMMEANESRDAALIEVSKMKLAMRELSQKFEYLESYCVELKSKNFSDRNVEKLLPVSKAVMVDGFMQIISDSRLSVKQFCKTLVGQIEESDHSLMNNINLLLQPYKLSLSSNYFKSVLHHIEGHINQFLYQDFENCAFQKNGSPKILNPHQDRLAKFQSFVALQNLSWNQVLSKGTKYYSDEFSRFCDDKMREIIAILKWTRPWSEHLLQAFFGAAKCIWLLHLLAFSFNPPLAILRVDENRPFEPHFMEDVLGNKSSQHHPSRVKMLVTPGFYVDDRIVKCKVLCKYRPLA